MSTEENWSKRNHTPAKSFLFFREYMIKFAPSVSAHRELWLRTLCHDFGVLELIRCHCFVCVLLYWWEWLISSRGENCNWLLRCDFCAASCALMGSWLLKYIITNVWQRVRLVLELWRAFPIRGRRCINSRPALMLTRSVQVHALGSSYCNNFNNANMHRRKMDTNGQERRNDGVLGCLHRCHSDAASELIEEWPFYSLFALLFSAAHTTARESRDANLTL
jgi:hypothetical protein